MTVMDRIKRPAQEADPSGHTLLFLLAGHIFSPL
jgi:hypothetical protein